MCKAIQGKKGPRPLNPWKIGQEKDYCLWPHSGYATDEELGDFWTTSDSSGKENV